MIQYLLYLHIFCGGLAFCSSPIAIIAAKGGKVHRLAGKIFSYAMYGVCATAFPIAFVKSNIFLIVIGIFSFYLVSSSNRVLNKKHFKKGDVTPFYDWALAITMLISGTFFLVYGFVSIFHGHMMGIVMSIFGFIGAYNAFLDIKIYRNGPSEKKFWILIHIGRMLGATTAAYTAFLVVNYQLFPFIPNWVLWLLPNIVFVPISIYFSRREGKKLR